MTHKRDKQEISSGGIVYRVITNKPQILLLKDPKGKWTFPKGLIEKGEDARIAAQREIAEETGLKKLTFKKDLGLVKYNYTYQDTFVYKTVYYFLFQSEIQEIPKPQLEEGISEVKYFNLDKVSEIIGYPKTNLPTLTLAQDYLKQNYAV